MVFLASLAYGEIIVCWIFRAQTALRPRDVLLPQMGQEPWCQIGFLPQS